MAPEQSSDQSKLQLSMQQKISILLSFAKDKVIEQIQCVWFIIMYLVVFQILVLGLPIVYSLMIAVGILIVIVGLAFFMEGLRLGLMPLGETLGSTLPRKKILGIPCLPASLAFGFVLGAFASHLLKTLLTETSLHSFETGARYMMYHGLALLLVSVMQIEDKKWIYRFFFWGTILFSFSIFLKFRCFFIISCSFFECFLFTK